MARGKKSRNLVATTSAEFASQTTIHGIGYIFDRKLSVLERGFWIFVVLTFLAAAVYLFYNSWTQWRRDQVVMKQLSRWSPELVIPGDHLISSSHHLDISSLLITWAYYPRWSPPWSRPLIRSLRLRSLPSPSVAQASTWTMWKQHFSATSPDGEKSWERGI